jgi:hypothetical protein
MAKIFELKIFQLYKVHGLLPIIYALQIQIRIQIRIHTDTDTDTHKTWPSR